MMTFTEFSSRLAMGQMKNTGAVDKSVLGEINPDYIKTILSLTNQGLVDLSTKFPLVTAMLDLTFIKGQQLYPLVSVGVGSYLEVVDSVTFVETDFVKVLDVIAEDGRTHAHDTNGHIMTPNFNSLRFSTDSMLMLDPKVRIRYQSKHLPIVETDTINLPPNLETALQLFVASLYFSHMNGAEHTAKGDAYFATYLRHIGEDEAKNNSSVSEVQEDTRFEDRGFV